ncbi:MAG: hypothetical protein HY319_03755 [Armatimonadetes bacterium]|nr:hypothetical protein [Armatimonadota bacterium]
MRLRLRQGVTLMEILIAIGIVAIAILALVAVFISGTKLVAQSQEVATGTQVARAELERIRDSGYDRVPDTDLTFDGRIPDATVSGFPPLPYPSSPEGYQVVVTVSQRGYYLKSVTVEAHWGSDQRVVLQTYLHP